MLDEVLHCVTRIKVRLIYLGVECATTLVDNHKIKLLALELRQLVCALEGTPGSTLYENAGQVLWITTGRWRYINTIQAVNEAMCSVLATLKNYGKS
jgi:hypothetical protein